MLTNKIAFITGGGTGIGKAIGVQLAKNGAKVALASRNPAHVESAAAELKTLGLSLLPLQMDVRNKLEIQRRCSQCFKPMGRHSHFRQQRWDFRVEHDRRSG